MAILRRIFVIHTTADSDDANTDAGFQIQVVTPGGDFIQDFPDLDHDERERGRTDQYEFDVEGKRINSQDPNFEIRMRMTTTEDGWLPRSIWVLGETIENQIIVLGAHPEWEGGFFDRGDPNTPDEHVISSTGNIAPFPS